MVIETPAFDLSPGISYMKPSEYLTPTDMQQKKAYSTLSERQVSIYYFNPYLLTSAIINLSENTLILVSLAPSMES
jgi:hypothetical protein